MKNIKILIIKRSTYIYNNYKEIMNKIYFNYNILCKISNKDLGSMGTISRNICR